MCHFRVPELNGDGRAYMLRGLREKPHGSVPESDMGMEMAKTGVAASPRSLGEALPLSLSDYATIMGHPGVQTTRHQRTKVNAGMVEGWIGGPLNRQWSAFVLPVFDIDAGTFEVEQAYGQWITDWSGRFGSVRFGQFLPLAILLHQGGPAMPLSAPLILSVSTAEDIWAPSTALHGIEMGAVDLEMGNAFVGVVQPQAEGGGTTGQTDFFVSTEYFIGEEGDAVSGLGYIGALPSSHGEPSVDYERIAVFADVYPPRMKGGVGFLWGRDKPEEGRSLDSSGGFILVEALPSQRWAAYGRYDYFTQEVLIGDDVTMNGPAAGISFWAHTQVRLTIEAQFLKTTGEARDRAGTAELLWAF